MIRQHGGPEVLQPADLPIPEPARGEALVRVKAVSVGGFLDVANRMGRVAFARYSFPHVLGSEHAGEVAAFVRVLLTSWISAFGVVAAAPM